MPSPSTSSGLIRLQFLSPADQHQLWSRCYVEYGGTFPFYLSFLSLLAVAMSLN